MEFYDLKLRTKVQIPKSDVTKTIITMKNGQVRHAFRGKTSDGRVLNKFCSKADWDATYVPVEES
ncbi:MAG: hypothetical protein H8E35_05980 [Ardenticatenia bacterium]|nr:hypothetical protein [Ardenticatenia bacterium]